MNNLKIQNNDLFSCVKNIILKYCPFKENRLYIIDDAKKEPEIEIEIDFCDDKTLIRFLVGTSTFKYGVSEMVQVEYYIDFDEIKKIIDFILNDHEIIKYIEISKDNIFRLGFDINWCDRTIKGIACGNIKIEMNFHSNIELRNRYLYLFLNNYFSYLEKVPSFIKIKNDYLEKIKLSYFSSLNKTELMRLLNQMSEDELRRLLSNLDNDLFIKYTTNNQDEYESKKLILEKQ